MLTKCIVCKGTFDKGFRGAGLSERIPSVCCGECFRVYLMNFREERPLPFVLAAKKVELFKDQDWTMRSNYERRLADVFVKHRIPFLYEPYKFFLSSKKAYVPDFYIPGVNIVVEAKGWWRADAKQKFKAFIEEYPKILTVLADDEFIRRVRRKANDF